MYQYFQLGNIISTVLFLQAVRKRFVYHQSCFVQQLCAVCVWQPCWSPQTHSTASWMVIWVTYCWVPWQSEKQQGMWSRVTQSYKRKPCFHWRGEGWKRQQTGAGGHGLEHTDQCEQEGGYPCSGKGRRAQDCSIVGEEGALRQTWWKGFDRGSSALTGC